MGIFKVLDGIFRVFDGIETVIYVLCGAALLVGASVLVFMKVAEFNLTLAIAGGCSLAIVVGGAVVHDLIRHRMSLLTKTVLALWIVATFAVLALDFIITLHS